MSTTLKMVEKCRNMYQVTTRLYVTVSNYSAAVAGLFVMHRTWTFFLVLM
jgi:hypothetical protein